MNILILGCGKLGQALAIQLHQKGHTITTISKSPKALPNGIIHLCQDIHSLDLSNCPTFDKVFVILSPNERSLIGYQSAYLDTIKPIYTALSHQLEQLQNIVYISSTRVYDNDKGDIVNDDTPILAYDNNDPFAKILIASELLYQAYFGNKAIIIRPSGLYSNNSERLIKMANNLNKISERHYMNLIHRNDVVDFLVHLSTLIKTEPSYILNAQTYVRGDFLNQLRQNQGLAPITMADNLPTTGKQLIATRMHQSGFAPQYPIL